MSKYFTIITIIFCYVLFAVLMNSVGAVILQSINTFGISKSEASILEGFKDLPIALVSFFIASLIPRIGYKIALMFALLSVAGICIFVVQMATFWSVKLLFASVGVAYAIVKITVYALIGQLTNEPRRHSSLLNTIEGFFMVGVLAGYWIFSIFINVNDPTSYSWLNIYYLMSGLLVICSILAFLCPISQSVEVSKKASTLYGYVEMFKLSYQPLTLIFIISIFMYVLIEQGIGTWLPTFNNQVLGLRVDISIQITSIFAAMLALGRLCAGFILKSVTWFPFLVTCLLSMMLLILISLPLAENASESEITSLAEAPLAAFLIPIIGFLMAPIYPVLNSLILTSLPQRQHASMTGLILIFSALGGTTGSIVTGMVFDKMGGQTAFYITLIPAALILVCLVMFRQSTQKMSLANA